MKNVKRDNDHLILVDKILKNPDSEAEIVKNLINLEAKHKIDWYNSNYSEILTILICLGNKQQIAQYFLKKGVLMNCVVNKTNYLNDVLVSLFNNKQTLIFSQVLTLLKENLVKNNLNFNKFLKTFFDENMLEISSFNNEILESLKNMGYEFSIEQILCSTNTNLIKFFFENKLQSIQLCDQNTYINDAFDSANACCNESACEYLIFKGADTSKLNDGRNYLEQLITNINNVNYSQNCQLYKLLEKYLSLGLTSREKITEDGFSHLLINIKYNANKNPKDIIKVLQHFKPNFLKHINLVEPAEDSVFNNYKYWHELKKAQSYGPLQHNCDINKISNEAVTLQRLSAEIVVDKINHMTEEQADIYLQNLNNVLIEYVTTILMGEEPTYVD